MIGLSGGNQQKVLFARWVHACKEVLLLDEPTRGVDVGAKAEIYRLIRRLADEGLAILMISSELLEVIGMSDRTLVMRDGRICGELRGDEINEQAIIGSRPWLGAPAMIGYFRRNPALLGVLEPDCPAHRDRLFVQQRFSFGAEFPECLRAVGPARFHGAWADGRDHHARN